MSNRTQLPGWLSKAGLVILAFVAVSCGDDNPGNPPTTGSIAVTAATAGDNIDADGYTVAIDDLAGRAIGVNATETFTNLSAGAHEVTLSGVAANCTVAGDNPRTVTVTAGSTATTTFDVTCSATAGELQVTTVSTGDDIDADGYTVSVDGGAAQDIDANGTLTIPGLEAGDYSVELGDVAANCTVAGDNPRTIAVTAGGTAQTQFDVACTALPGDLNVVNVTTGDNQDDAYTVSLDGGAAQALAANDSLSFADLSAGDHTVELGDVASNCTVGGDNPRTVAVTSGGEVRTQFDVDCVSGSLAVTSNTWGIGIDADGYSVVIDGGTPQAIGVNETVGIGLAPGDYSVELTGLAANCTVQDGTNPRTETVTAEAATATTFDVFCWENLNKRLVFETDRDGDRELYSWEPGGQVSNLTLNSADDRNPTVSPDGMEVVFESTRSGMLEIWKMTGGGFTKLSSLGGESDPSYSGNATVRKIAYVRRSSGQDQIYTMGAGGANKQAMSSAPGAANDIQPAYSPDGNWILFASDRDGDLEIYVVNVGTGVETRLTNDAGVDGKPAWWFDGSRVLWASDRTGDLDVWAADFDSITPALGVPENLTSEPTRDDLMPAMRPDAGGIAFVSGTAGSEDIWTMSTTGTSQSPLTVTGSRDLNPVWSP